MRVAFVSRELYPLAGGGIGVQVAGACAALAEDAEVTVVTSSELEPAYRRLQAAGGPTPLDGVRVAFVQEPRPEDVGTYYGMPHLYSARVWDRLRELYPDGGPDLVEFSDFMGEALVTVQARRGHDPLLRSTQVCVRLHTSAEICSILDGHLDESFDARMVVAAERHALRHADRLIAPDAAVLDTYARFYGEGDGEAAAGVDPDADAARALPLAPAVTIPPVVPFDREPTTTAPSPAGGLRFLYVGRLERRKGVQELLRAFTGLADDGWRLTLAGGDTATAPLGASMRATLELAAAGDPRIDFHGEVSRDEVRGLIDGHDVVVAPSLWECWPSTVLEALGRNRPVLATPTGGMPAMLGDEGAGWLTHGAGAEALTEAVELLIADPACVAEATSSGAPLRRHRELNDPARLRDRYRALAELAPDRPARAARRDRPLVSVVIPYFKLERFVEDAVRSVFDQDYESLEAIVVNDGSLRGQDEILDELSARFPIRVLTQQNAGLSRARNAGVAHSRGDYVLPLDADNMLDRTFVSRCMDVLDGDPDAAFATAWSQYISADGRPLAGAERGFQPVGNSDARVLADNIAGDGTALIRREVFERGHRYSPDLASYEDWQLYRELHRAGLFGVVIPERLLIYRVRDNSMVREVGLRNHGRLYGEMQAHLREGEVEWLCASAPTTIR